MSKYINADELKENINEELDVLLYYFSSQNKDGLINRGVDIALKVINNSPESIVRCKECKHFNIDTALSKAGDIECGFCEYHDCYLLKWGYDYCSRGERRENE